jgi:cytochrome c-type biogenesis protein CcmE
MKITLAHVVISVLLILSIALAYDAFTSYINPYLDVSQIVKNIDVYLNREVQVMGTIVNGSSLWRDGSWSFNITDGQTVINVVYKGALPQGFKEGEQVVVIGKPISRGTIESYKMLIKCPSKYEGGSGSLFANPVFLIAVVIGLGAILSAAVSIVWKRSG